MLVTRKYILYWCICVKFCLNNQWRISNLNGWGSYPMEDAGVHAGQQVSSASWSGASNTGVWAHTGKSTSHTLKIAILNLSKVCIHFILFTWFFFKSRQSLTVSHFTRLTSKVKSPISVSWILELQACAPTPMNIHTFLKDLKQKKHTAEKRGDRCWQGCPVEAAVWPWDSWFLLGDRQLGQTLRGRGRRNGRLWGWEVEGAARAAVWDVFCQHSAKPGLRCHLVIHFQRGKVCMQGQDTLSRPSWAQAGRDISPRLALPDLERGWGKELNVWKRKQKQKTTTKTDNKSLGP